MDKIRHSNLLDWHKEGQPAK